MKVSFKWILLVFVAAGLLVAVAGCGETQTIVRTVTATQPVAGSSTFGQDASAAPAASSSSSSQSQQQAKVGDQISLTGSGGLDMGVTVDQVMDPLSVGPDDQADSGQRFVGVQITLKNLGNVAYSDSPSNGATLLSSSGEQATSEIVSGGPCGNDFGSRANIASGDSEQGCIAFELPDSETPGQFQFTLNSGFADETGQWSLAGADTSSGSDESASGVSTTAGAATSESAQSSAQTPGADPGATLRTHLADLGSGEYQAAFALMSSSYQSQNPSWVQDRSKADPGVNIISVGDPQDVSGGAQVPVDFYARDRHPTPGSDTKCREFQGTASMIQQSGGWRYSPDGNSLSATVVPSSNPNCP